MKLLKSILLTIIIIINLAACGMEGKNQNTLQGVSVTEDGKAAVTFTIPEGKTVEDVLGCDIKGNNEIYIYGKGGSIDWYTVEKGGILSEYGKVYKYAPEAEVPDYPGFDSPPVWALLLEMPEENEIFDPGDAKKLSEEYGIDLYFG